MQIRLKRTFIITGILTGILSCGSPSSQQPSTRSLLVDVFASPAKDSSSLPCLMTDATGKVLCSWVEKRNGLAELKFSTLYQDQWTLPVTIASGHNWFVNWADYPAIASLGNGNLIAHYLEKSDTSIFAYDIRITISSDNGRTWSSPVTLNNDHQTAEHGFVSFAPDGNRFFASWLDGRNNPAKKGSSHQEHHGAMTVRAAMIGHDGITQNEWQLDERVCDCCQTSAAMTSRGPVVVYRDRSENEIRDIAIVRYVNGLWTAPSIIHADGWTIEGCPVNGPRVDAKGDHLAVAWFTAPDAVAQVNLAFSKDGGEHFGSKIRIDEGKPKGRIDVLLLNDTTAVVSWIESTLIKAVKVYASGKKDPSFVVASSSDARASGFPQMTRYGDHVLFAWTDIKTKYIKMAEVSL